MEDIEYFLSCLLALAWWILGVSVLTAILVFGGRKPNQPPRWILVMPILVVSAAAWIIYYSATGKQTWTLILLDSEDDRTAENAYDTLFKVDLDKAISLARDSNQSGNIRFYAAFRAADLLVTNDEKSIERVLQRLRGSQSIHPDFFGTNGLTCGYFEPCHQEGPFEVGDLIRRRLQDLRNQTNAAAKL